MMATDKKITYCLWVNHEALQVVDFYTSVFDQAQKTDIVYNPVDTPSGKTGGVLAASFNLEGQEFMVLNGGSECTLNPSVSFMVNCETADQVDALWEKLSTGGKVRMPLDRYPFSDRYGWIEDKYGVSWQLMLPKGEVHQKVVPSLMFVNDVCGKAEEAISYYTSVFHDAEPGMIARYPAGMEPDKEGTIMYANFMLEGQWFAVMDSAREHGFNFNEAVSLVVHCDTQQEVDYYWDKLTAEGKEIQCGWLKDKYGVCWQITPRVLLRLLQGKDTERAKRVMEVMMNMVKLDIAPLEQA